MRLTLVQKALKRKNITYQYSEVRGCGQISFDYNNKHYMVDETTGNRGVTPTGIYTNLEYFDKFSTPTQRDIVAYINEVL